MKSAILGLVLALAAWSATGETGESRTGEIRGRVLALKSNQPIAYANVIVVGTTMGAMSLGDGSFKLVNVPAGTYAVRVMMMGYAAVEKSRVIVEAGKVTEVDFAMETTIILPAQECRVMAMNDGVEHARGGRSGEGVPPSDAWRYRPPVDREQCEFSHENEFLKTIDNPLSTFSIDVDAASYSNMRRFVRDGALPPPDAVRIEEFINYFDYDYPDPTGDKPFSITTEVAGCPWNSNHRLVHIGLQGRRIDTKDLPASNLVFLIDVSGSMQPGNKLPLLRRAFPLLVGQLRPQDSVAIVVYAGSAGLVLASTPGDRKRDILEAIERLEAGGSTAGGAGIVLAYNVAAEHFIKGGNNRVILATDGDFNVGVTSDGDLVRLIEEKRTSGIFLTVLGVGEGNLQDAKMERLADHGNGNYSYLDDILEAQKVFVSEMGGTVVTIAKDVKIQVEFNPARVESYRLIGYENRMLRREDFADDAKDAGEMGAGHSVTALYEIAPAQARAADGGEDLTYTETRVKPSASERREIMMVRLRYKTPEGEASRLIERAETDGGANFESASDDFRFSAAVAELGLLLRDSPLKADASLDHVIEAAADSRGEDANGYRAEFVQLAQMCLSLKPELAREGR